MPILDKFPSLLRYDSVFPSPILQNLHFPLSFHHSLSRNRANTSNFRVLLSKQSNGFILNALKIKKKGYVSQDREVQGNFEDAFDDDFVDERDTSESEDTFNDDDEVFVPLENMQKWLKNRPRGFGEGKVYDTSVEDKLMEEIEQSRKAQFDNINKLQQNAMKSNSKKDSPKQEKALVGMPSGFRVRVVNLPKKMNIHKDLRLAFKEVPGVLDIVPVVSGNEKTRDPICQGIAFIDFKQKDEAERFVKNFSGRSICFGKVDKKIKCEMLISKFPVPTSDQSVTGAIGTYERDNLSEAGSNANLDRDMEFLNSWEESSKIKDDDGDENQVLTQWDADEESMEPSNPLDFIFSEKLECKPESAIKTSYSKQGRKLKQKAKMVASNTRNDRIAKLTVSGSAKKLKIREKALLTEVFTKYGAGSMSGTNDQSK